MAKLDELVLSLKWIEGELNILMETLETNADKWKSVGATVIEELLLDYVRELDNIKAEIKKWI